MLSRMEMEWHSKIGEIKLLFGFLKSRILLRFNLLKVGIRKFEILMIILA